MALSDETPDQRRIRLAGEQAQADGLARIRAGATGPAPTPDAAPGLGDQPDPRLRNEGGYRPLQSSRAQGFSQRAVDALDRAKQFTSAPGTLTRGPLEQQVRPRAQGALLGAGLGAFDTAMNAASVYDQTGGDIGQTARQVAFDAPGAVGATLGSVAGGVLGRRNPTAATAGMLAGGAFGQTGGDQIASGISRLTGGDGLSPLQELEARRAAGPQDNTVYVSPGDADVPLAQADGGVPVNALTGLPVAPTAPTAAASAPVPTQAPQPAAVQPQAAAQAQIDPASLGGYGQTGIPGIVGRNNDQGVPEFSNNPSDVADATGRMTAGGRLGDGRGTFSVGAAGDSALALQRFERANQIRRGAAAPEYGLGDRTINRAAAQQDYDRQRMEINDASIAGLLRSGNLNDRRQARALQAENAAIAARSQGNLEAETRLGLGQMTQQAANYRTDATNANQRQYLALLRRQQEMTRNQANSREDIAQQNSGTYEDRVTGAFGQLDADGKTVLDPQVNDMLTQRAPQYAQQREAAFRESAQALQQRVAAGDTAAQAQLQQLQNDYARFRQDVYRVDSNGNPVELRPIREWSEDNAQQFFTDVKDQQRRQGAANTIGAPAALGAGAGALAGLAAGARVPGGPRARIISGLAGAALGGLAGQAAQNEATGPRSTAPLGAGNQSATLASNYNRVGVDGDNVVATLNDGQVVNLSDLLYEDVNPSLRRSPGSVTPSFSRGRRTSQYAPVIRTTFNAAVAQAQSQDPVARQQAQDVLAQFAQNDDLYATLTPDQRKVIPRNPGLGGQ